MNGYSNISDTMGMVHTFHDSNMDNFNVDRRQEAQEMKRILDRYTKNDISLYILQDKLFTCILEYKFTGEKEILSTHSTREEARRALESYREDYL